MVSAAANERSPERRVREPGLQVVGPVPSPGVPSACGFIEKENAQIPPRTFNTLILFLAAILLAALPLRAAVPDYKLGDTAQEDVIMPVTLNVLNAEATETLKNREASRVPLVFKINTNATDEAEFALRDAFHSARTNFEDALHRTMKGKPDNERVVGSVLFDQAVMSAQRRVGSFPLLEQLAPLWARDESDAAMQSILVRQLREVMSRPVVAGRPEGFNSKNSIRLVDVDALDETLTTKDVEQRGYVVRGEQVLRLTDARSQIRTNIFAQLKAAGGYLASFVHTNAMEDVETASSRLDKTINETNARRMGGT